MATWRQGLRTPLAKSAMRSRQAPSGRCPGARVPTKTKVTSAMTRLEYVHAKYTRSDEHSMNIKRASLGQLHALSSSGSRGARMN